MSTAAWPFYMELALNSVEQGNLMEAEELCHSAVREAEAIDAQGRRLSASLHALGAVAGHRGRYLRAEHLYYRAWTVLKSACGENAAETAAVQAQVGWACVMQSKYAEAEPLFNEAIPVLEMARPLPLTALVRALHGLGDVH